MDRQTAYRPCPSKDASVGRKKCDPCTCNRACACPSEPLNALAATILKEKSTAHNDSIRALWRVGDHVLRARELAPFGSWRTILAECAAAAGVHPGSLDDAARAAKAFPAEGRECLLTRCADAGMQLTRSHVVLLSRMTPPRRMRAIQAMLRAPCSVADLRLL